MRELGGKCKDERDGRGVRGGGGGGGGAEVRKQATAKATANTGISPLRRQSALPPVEMTVFWGALRSAKRGFDGRFRMER